EPGGLCGQNQECRLKSVLSIVLVANNRTTDAQHLGSMPLDQRSESQLGRVALPVHETSEQLPIRKTGAATDFEEQTVVARSRRLPRLLHRSILDHPTRRQP